MVKLKEKDDFLNSFSKRIKELRILNRKKIGHFSADSNMENSTIYRVENENSNMYIYTAYKILKNLDVDLLDILDGEIRKKK